MKNLNNSDLEALPLAEKVRAAEIYSQLDWHSTALEIFQQVGTEENNKALLYSLLGQSAVCFRQHHYAKAKEFAELALEKFPAHFETLLILGYIESALNNPNRAIELFEIANSIRPEAQTVSTAMARAMAKMGEFVKAAQYFSQALSSHNTDLSVHRDYARCLITLGRVRDAINALANGLKEAPEKTELWVDLAEIMTAIGGGKFAMDFLQGGASFLPSQRPELLLQTARLALTLGETDRALHAISCVESLIENSAHNLTLLAKLRFSCGDIDGALSNVEQALELDMNFAETHYFVGYLYDISGEYSVAMAAYQRALEFDKGHWRSALNLAILRRQEGVEIKTIPALLDQAECHKDAPKTIIHSLRTPE